MAVCEKMAGSIWWVQTGYDAGNNQTKLDAPLVVTVYTDAGWRG